MGFTNVISDRYSRPYTFHVIPKRLLFVQSIVSYFSIFKEVSRKALTNLLKQGRKQNIIHAKSPFYGVNRRMGFIEPLCFQVQI